jgi:hypoxanthine phosphoribosyltransferase
MNIKKLDWNQYHSYIDKLAVKINSVQKTHDKYKYIVGIDPDDLFVAVHLSHQLHLPVITDINILSLLVGFTDSNQSVLVVSNIVATGDSFKEIEESTGTTFDTASIFVDKESKVIPTYHVEMPDDIVYFPWQQCGIPT